MFAVLAIGIDKIDQDLNDTGQSRGVENGHQVDYENEHRLSERTLEARQNVAIPIHNSERIDLGSGTTKVEKLIKE